MSKSVDDWSHLFDVRRSIFYHMRRQAFYEKLHKSITGIAIIFGSATVIGVLQNMNVNYTAGAAAFVSITSAIDLIIGTTTKAWQHADLKRKFIELEKKQLIAKKVDDKLLKVLQGERLIIEADEPPIYRALDIICYNDVVYAEYATNKVADKLHKIPLYKKLTANIIMW